MAGYTKIYCVGGLGGFMGTDGINPIKLQIWQGDGERQWLEARYFSDEVRPIGRLARIIPRGPDQPNGLLDACIAFYPQAFESCPSLKVVRDKLTDKECLDFDLDVDSIPNEWSELRAEALGPFRGLHIYEAELKKIQPE